jgi:hypothetical protein
MDKLIEWSNKAAPGRSTPKRCALAGVAGKTLRLTRWFKKQKARRKLPTFLRASP